jgi:hypothetical protein
MSDTCTRCGTAEAAPGEFGDRCAGCIEEIARNGYDT